jgi:lipopolysaccharide transport system permease protein
MKSNKIYMDRKEKTITANISFASYLKEIWESKELLWILAKKDVLVKYKQSVFGIAWSAVRPLITTLVMAFAFGKIGGNIKPEMAINFTLVVIPGVIVWLFFSQSLLSLSQSIVFNSNLVTKVFFPRIIIPLSTIFLGLIDVLIAICVFLSLCVWFQFLPDWKIVFVPIFILLSFLAAFGIGLIAAVLNVKYRDIGQLVPFIIQFGYFISPVGYTTEMAKAQLSPIYYKIFLLNPVTGVADALRWSMLGNYAQFNWDSFIPLIIFILISLVFSIFFFRKHENSFVDYI